MTINVRQIVQVNPAVLSAAGSAVDLNGLFLSESPYTPIGSVMPFTNAKDVGTFYGLSSPEYTAAQNYFQGPLNATKTPGLLYFAQYNVAAAAGYLRGGSVAGMTLTQLQALTGTLTITADGIVNTSATIVLTTDTSFSQAAATIQAAFTTPGFAVTYDAQHNAFVFTSNTTGVASSLAFATGTLAASLNATSATGAVLSAGAAAATPSSVLNGVIGTQLNWATFSTTWEPVLADKESFSAWSALQGERFLYVGYDSDVNALTSGSTATWAYAVSQLNSDGTCPVFGNITHAAFLMGQIASLDFTRLNGRATSAFKQQSGLAASITTDAQYQALIANGYNFYGAFGNGSSNFEWFYPGSLLGQWKWIDSYVNQIWMNAQLQLAMLNLLLAVPSIPSNAQGNTLIDAACQDPLAAAVNFGAIRTGVALSVAQAADIRNAVGLDVSNVLYQQGYYLQILPASAAARAARTSPPMTLYYMDGGSVQQLTLASIEVQ